MPRRIDIGTGGTSDLHVDSFIAVKAREDKVPIRKRNKFGKQLPRIPFNLHCVSQPIRFGCLGVSHVVDREMLAAPTIRRSLSFC